MSNIELQMTLEKLSGPVGKAVFFFPIKFVSTCTKYTYQYEAMGLPAHAGLEAAGGLAYVVKFLPMTPQEFAVAAGNLPVVMFDLTTSSPQTQLSRSQG